MRLHRLVGLPGALLAALGLLLAPLPAAAAPFADHFSFTQPDGTPFTFWGEGDEFHAVFETVDGYAVVFDQAQQAYFYAERSTDGKSLRSTGVLAHLGAPARLDKHGRVDRDAAASAARVRQRKWDEGTRLSARWSDLKARRRSAAADPAAAPPSTTTVGAKVGLTLLIDFSDAPATIAQSEIEAFLNGDAYTGSGNNGSVKKYFSDVSASRLTYTNVATIYVRMSRAKSYYNDTTKDCGEQGRLLIKDALAILKARGDYASTILPTFGSLSTDGSGNALAFNVLYAGGNGGVWSYGLWPHSWALANPVALGNGVSVSNYQITNIGSSLTLGTFCHENGHMLCGFPDIYDYDYDSVGGAGAFCLMNSGGHGTNPSQVSAYLKLAAGWVTANDLPANGTGTLVAAPTSGYDQVYRHRRAGVSTEYFLLENRQRTGRDSGLPAAGIAIWHIDELGDRDDQRLAANTTHSNYEVTLVQADNLWHFQNDVNDGDSRDLYYSGNGAAAYTNRFSDSTSPSARWWSGTASGLNLSAFSAAAASMTFTVGSGPTLPTVQVSATDGTATENPLTTGTLTVSRTGSTASSLAVTYTVGGTATSGSDYAGIGTGITIPAGAASATITVTPVDDAAAESSETVVVTLAASAAYTVGSPSSATVTITSDDVAPPTVRVSATDGTAAENPLTTGTLTVSRTGSTASSLAVTYTVGGTATSGSDYAGVGTSLTIPAGAASATITVTPVDDAETEVSETVIVTLAASAAYTVGSPASATVTVVDDDATGYALWTRSDTGHAALWTVRPGDGSLTDSLFIYPAGVGGPWQATSYAPVDAATGYLLWTRADTGQAALWEVNPGTGALISSRYLYRAAGVGAPWEATSYAHVDATTGYVLWTRGDTGQAALWQVDPGDGSITAARFLWPPAGVGRPWQATSYHHVDATTGYVLWTRSDTGQAALWQVNPDTGALVSSVYLLSSKGVGGPWHATSYDHLGAAGGYVLWTRSDTGQAALWQVNPASGAVNSSVYLYRSTGVGAPWQATGFQHVDATGDARPGARADLREP